jgi:septum formation protein
MEPIILASSSPRRQEILKLMNIPYQVIMPNIEETIPDDMTTDKAPEYLATQKVNAVARSLPAGLEIPWILGADTIVTLNGKIYGKPVDQEDAARVLTELQGKTHKVITGMSLYNGKLHFLSTRSAATLVTFSSMTIKEIEWYVSTGDWHGAAGGYRIQGLASCFIQNIEGTNSNVVGLPIFELYDMLKEQGYSILD